MQTSRHHRKFSPGHILSQKNPHTLALNAFEIVVELALLGRIESATQLFTLFADLAPVCKNIWSPGMYFAWAETHSFPECIPQSQRTEDFIHSKEIERVLWKRSTCCSDEGLEELINVALGHGRTDRWGNQVIRGEDLKAAIDLAAYMEKPEKVEQLLNVFAEHFDSVWYRLARSRLAWKYIKNGALARAIGIDEAKLLTFEKEILTTFTQRLQNGPVRPFQDTPMKDLIALCDTNTLQNAVWSEMDGIDPDDPPTSVTHPGATAADIASLEQKIGFDLAADYKEFLALSNGLGPLWNGFHGEPPLLPAEQVHTTNATKQKKAMRAANQDPTFFMGVKMDWEPLAHVIQINEPYPNYDNPAMPPDLEDDDELERYEHAKFIWLIPPQDITAVGKNFFAAVEALPAEQRDAIMKNLGYLQSDSEDLSINTKWSVISWAPGTMEYAQYGSFREYLEVVAMETAEKDILDEEDEEGRLVHSQEVFAYQLR